MERSRSACTGRARQEQLRTARKAGSQAGQEAETRLLHNGSGELDPVRRLAGACAPAGLHRPAEQMDAARVGWTRERRSDCKPSLSAGQGGPEVGARGP
jgi:hypothetical protein